MPTRAKGTDVLNSGSVLPPWKVAIVAALAVPSLYFSEDVLTGAGVMVAIALVAALVLYVLTGVARRTRLSRHFEPRTWKLWATTSVVTGFVIAAVTRGGLYDGVEATLFHVSVAVGVFLTLLVYGLILKSGPEVPVRPK